MLTYMSLTVMETTSHSLRLTSRMMVNPIGLTTVTSTSLLTVAVNLNIIKSGV